MPRARQWMGELLLHAPQPLRSLRNLPLLGGWIHRVSHRVLPLEEKVWARVEAGPAQGLWLELNPRTGQNYLRGEAELTVQKILAERLRPGMVFYDLGANIGLFTLLASRLVGDSGKVFSFEPDPENAARLRRNVERNGFTNVTVIEKGIWSASTKLNFLKSGADSPDHGIGKFSAAENGAGGTLTQCVSLDDFIREAPDAARCAQVRRRGRRSRSPARRREAFRVAPPVDRVRNAFRRESPRRNRIAHRFRLYGRRPGR